MPRKQIVKPLRNAIREYKKKNCKELIKDKKTKQDKQKLREYKKVKCKPFRINASKKQLLKMIKLLELITKKEEVEDGEAEIVEKTEEEKKQDIKYQKELLERGDFLDRLLNYSSVEGSKYKRKVKSDYLPHIYYDLWNKIKDNKKVKEDFNKQFNIYIKNNTSNKDKYSINYKKYVEGLFKKYNLEEEKPELNMLKIIEEQKEKAKERKQRLANKNEKFEIIKNQFNKEVKEMPKKQQQNIKDCDNALDTLFDILSGKIRSYKNIKINNASGAQILNNLVDQVRYNDLYVTPREVGKVIYKDIDKYYEGYVNVVDAGAGLLSLSKPFIEQGVKKLTLVELNNAMAEILKCYQKLSYVNVVNNNFLEWKPKVNDCEVILTNPPFAGQIKDKKGSFKDEKKFYLYFLAKAIDLLHSSNSKDIEKDIYMIMPTTVIPEIEKYKIKEGDFIPTSDIKISKNLYEDMINNIEFKNPDNVFEKYENQYMITFGQVNFIQYVPEFTTLDNRGRPKVLKLGNTALLKFLIL